MTTHSRYAGLRRQANRTRSIARAAAGLAAVLVTSAAYAGSLTYQPTNPAFGGSPLNGSWLQSQAQIHNEYERREQRRKEIEQQMRSEAMRAATRTPGQQFAQQLQSQLYGSLANQITQAIFGENAQNSGTFSIQGTSVSFQRTGGNIELTINDGQSTTTVAVPSAP